MPKVLERFLQYVHIDTRSNEDSTTVPSTPAQLDLARVLHDELQALGLNDVLLDDKGYVYATLPANTDQKVPRIGFIAHMDTSPDMSGSNVKPQIIENYPGGDIVLNSEQHLSLTVEAFPELQQYIGKTLITTDGTTLLGADDKAGIAEIMTALEYLAQHPEMPHGKISIGFTPDEEIGRGADYFDVESFGADFAYTVDGGPIGELEYENFNAAKAVVTVHGRNVHPGRSKGKMINSTLLASEFIALLPAHETPAHTEGYEGFYHLNNMHGDVEETVLHYILRDFDSEGLEKRKKTVQDASQQLNKKYGAEIFTVEIKDQYRNMREKIEPVIHIVETAKQAMEEVGIQPDVKPIRGGTDGARLSFMGLPTPNLFAGGHNAHGKYEFIPTFALEKGVELILKIIEIHAQTSSRSSHSDRS